MASPIDLGKLKWQSIYGIKSRTGDLYIGLPFFQEAYLASVHAREAL